jgi:SAM-dependent methyltransferase
VCVENKYPYPSKNKGFCVCCEREVIFSASSDWYRDDYLCSKCGCRPRERALTLVIEDLYPNYRELRIHESSPIEQGVSPKMKNRCRKYIQTQYCAEHNLGKRVKGFRNENLECQTFPDQSFDLVITQDVMEHVFNPGEAFREIARTLVKGGSHIFTVPLVNKSRATEKWAEMGRQKECVFLHEPDYHGTFPVTYHYGYDIVDLIYESSGLITKIFVIDNLYYGIRAQLIEVLVSTKL